jgi:hypothetical protein
VLRSLGFVVDEHPFEYSQLIGRWAPPLVGFACAVLASIWEARAPVAPLRAAAILVIVALAAFLVRLRPRRGVLHGRLLRATGINVAAVRGEAPAVWLVAHIDSKWQPVSMLARVAGVLLLVVGFVGVIIAAAANASFGPAALVVTWLGAAPLMLSVVGVRNHGTLDNASGVAAVLDAARLVPVGCPLGIMITDAEELALAGAEAWKSEAAPVIALNCDSIDDDGPLVAMYTGAAPQRILSPLRRAASEHNERLRAMRLIPGILTDSVALARVGWPTLTLSRGTLRTLLRIHTSRDTLVHMSGRGVDGAARVLARTAMELAECK